MKKYKEFIIIFGIGAFVYGGIEVAFRGYTHWSMFITGGFLFYLLYKLFEYMGGGKILLKALLGCVIITTGEFLVGCVVNLIFNMNVWDYSEQSVNLFGQICLLFSLCWFLLCVPTAFIAKFISGRLRSDCKII